VKDNAIRFKLDKPRYLSLELNNENTRPLYLFADPLESAVPGANDSTVRVFKAGSVYEPGEIRLKSGETVIIEGGAVVRGNIVAEDANNIRMLGRGILDGGVFRNAERKKRMIDLLRCENVLIEGITILDSQTWTLVPQFCRNLNVRNLKEVCWQFGSDGVDVVGSSDVTVDACFMRNNDDNITLKTWGGTEKYPRQAEKGPDVERVRVLNSTFWNMAWGNALEIGFELRADFVRDVVFKNCDVIHVERGAVFSIHNGDFATVENIRYEDIRVEDARHKLIDLAVFLSQYSVDRPKEPEERKRRYMDGAWDGVLKIAVGDSAVHAPHRGRIRNIVFKDVAVVDGRPPFSILSGFDAGHPVEDVAVENLRFHGEKIKTPEDGKFFIKNAKGVRFR
jgi:polygalacturonase